jgi:rubrerythrin
MHKFKISKVRDSETMRTFTFRIRDLYEKYTFEAKAKAKDVMEAKKKIKEKLIGWGNMHILHVSDDQGKQYFGRELISFKDNDTTVNDWSGSYNGAYYDYTNGVWTITHKNGKVEKFPDEKFNATSEIKAYIDNFKDAGIAYIITTKKQDKFFDGKQLNTELKQAKKFDTKEKGIQAAEEAFGSNWNNNLDVIAVNSDLSAYASIVKDTQPTEQQIKEFAKQKGLSYVDAKRMLEESDNEPNYGESSMWKAMHDAGIEVTQESGTDKILYVMQSNADKNLYFYIGKTYSMKDGEWTYAKYKMNGVSPETIKKDLEANGWHQVSSGPARVIDSIKDSWADDAMKELNKKGKANWDEDDWETYHYIEQARHESGYYEDSSSIQDMALSRTDAMDRCISLGKQFIQHFDKMYKEPTNSATEHWLAEMDNWYKSVKQIKLKQNNSPLLTGELRDWFFTAGANAVDFMKSADRKEEEVYDKFVNDIISKDSVREAYKNLAGHIQDAVYNKYANENDKEFLKESLKEMRRYESNWSYMSANEKRNICPGGKAELKEHIKNAENRLRQLDGNSVTNLNASQIDIIKRYAKKYEENVEDIIHAIHQLMCKKSISASSAMERVLENLVAGSNLTDSDLFVKGAKYKNQNGSIVEIVQEPDSLGQVTYKINNVPKTTTKESFENMLSSNGYRIADEETPIDYEANEANEIARQGTVEEYNAIQAYEPMITRLKELYNQTQNEKYLKAAQDLEEINNEEKKHLGEFAKISADLDPKQSELVQEGMNEVDSATVKDSNVPDVKHTASYLWTWTDKGHEVADRIFDEQADKYHSKKERLENLDPIFNASMKQLNDYEKALKNEINKMFDEGSALNRQRIKAIYDKLKSMPIPKE